MSDSMGWAYFSRADREAARLLRDLMGWEPRDAGETSDEADTEQPREPEAGS
jgi:hypothetical protein